MQRRRFLRDLLSAATLAAVAPMGLARAGDPAEFAAGLQRHPWLEGWRSVGVESFEPAAATLRGRLPRGLAGTLYRNGPAWFERADFRYEHWFDGDGMVHAWRIGERGVCHRARMVATPKFERERKAGRFLMPAAGTRVPDAQPVRNNDDANTANTSVMLLGGRLFALYEGGSAFELSPDELTTIGANVWRPDLAALPFSAHPLREVDGSAWNFGAINLMGGSGLLLWRLAADGRVLAAQTLACPAQGYLHSFAMTSRHLVFVLTPFAMGERGAFFERLRFSPGQPCRIAVVPKDDLTAARWFEADFAMVYHYADAFERGGELVLRAVRHHDLEAARTPMRAAMLGHGSSSHGAESLAELRLDLRAGTARWRELGARALEFPQFDPRTPGDRGARLYAPTRVGDAPAFNAVAAIDAQGRTQVHRYGDGVIAEEHLFVPRPGSRAPDDGWLLGTLLDTRRRCNGLAVFDARQVDDGPIAEAWLDRRFPLGFHGAFAPA